MVGMLIDTKTVSTVLAFSGGQTRDGAGPRTEAFSYYARPLLFSPVKVPPELSSCRVQTCSAQLPRKNLQEITSENLLFRHHMPILLVNNFAPTSPTAASTSSTHGTRRYQADHYGFSEETLTALTSNVSQEYPYVKLSSDIYYGSHVPSSPQTPPLNVHLSNLTPAEALSRALSNNMSVDRPSSRNSSFRSDESPILSPTASLILESSFITTSSGSGNGREGSGIGGKDVHGPVIVLPSSTASNTSDVGTRQRRRGKRKSNSSCTGPAGRVKKPSVSPSSCSGKAGGGVAWAIFKLLGCAFAVGVGSYLVVKWVRPMIKF
ncbi:hypothetical protein SeLEV6574_g05078 [Synchytrium endobioticum]|uniref:Uncharacterized protein n=1 Tax=Synchytrium endobioticum TaxID=286115 RepID=A0A507CW16_9FUNG|nr:hypothetical protein SeLEV6574_g05078 [Synchytrium endobioticum]